MNDNHAILLVGHGTRDEQGTAQFFQLADRLAAMQPSGTTVHPALLEFQSPTIDEAWQSIAATSPDRVTVAPLLLFAAGHAKSDIPDAVAAAAKNYPIVSMQSLQHCPPISRQSYMIEAVRQRLTKTLEAQPTDEPIGIVMVGRGSHDPCASSDMRLLAEVVCFGNDSLSSSIAIRHAIERSNVATTFYAMAHPRLPDTLAALAKTDRVRRIIVHPHLLFSGRLHDSIVQQTNAVAQSFPSIRFDVSECLGPIQEVACSIDARIHQPLRRKNAAVTSAT